MRHLSHATSIPRLLSSPRTGRNHRPNKSRPTSILRRSATLLDCCSSERRKQQRHVMFSAGLHRGCLGPFLYIPQRVRYSLPPLRAHRAKRCDAFVRDRSDLIHHALSFCDAVLESAFVEHVGWPLRQAGVHPVLHLKKRAAQAYGGQFHDTSLQFLLYTGTRFAAQKTASKWTHAYHSNYTDKISSMHAVHGTKVRGRD